MSRLKVPDLVPSIMVQNYEDLYEDPQASPSTTTTSNGSSLASTSEEESVNIPIKVSINELHDMVTKMMMQRYGINPNENPRNKKGSNDSKGSKDEIPSMPTSPTSLEFARRASHVILEVPAHLAAGGLKKIAHNKNMGSMSRETNHFCGITTVHGPNRIYNGKGVYRYFWLLVFLICLTLLCLQIGLLIKEYFSFPITSEIKMTMPPNGLTFPTITVCNYNPIKQSYINEINTTGDFNPLLLNYITLAHMEVQYILSIQNSSELLTKGDDMFSRYSQKYNLSIRSFYENAGLSCEDTLKICSFGGQKFDCCSHAVPVLTDMGKCFRIQLDESSLNWLHTQKQAGINNGLQIIADVNTPEQVSGSSIYKSPLFDGRPIFANQLTMGMRFYVHIPRDLPHLVGDGISVRPGGVIYTSITPQQYTLLEKDNWGNCIENWPKDISLSGDYSSARCQAYCRSKYFHDKCGCSPFVYDLDAMFPPCSPYKLYQCIKDDSYESLEDAMKCPQCSIECERWTYATSNSYDFGYSPGAYAWLNEYGQTMNQNWTEDYIKQNFVTMNVFYKELTYSHFEQNQGSNLVVLLSNIGGNMGMFVGMSVLSCCEVLIYLNKIFWILFSKKRRDYLKRKKDMEKEREQKLEETLKNIKLEAEKAAEENETRLEKTMKKIQQEAFDAAKQAEEDAKVDKEKSIFSMLPAINAKVHYEDECDEYSDV